MLDGAAGLWCTNAGHNREPIVAAIQAQAASWISRRPSSSPIRKSFELASRIAALAPGRSRPRVLLQFGLGSGRYRDEDRARLLERAGPGAAHALHRPRARLSRRRLRRHVGRRPWQQPQGVRHACWPGVDHLPHTYNREQQAFSKGEPEWGAHLADELERIVALHGDTTIAAVIVEPMAGSTAVLPAPKGYLQRLRAICDKYGILLIFDEVITGFGRLGHAFAAERYGVVPDMITFAKGVTSGTVPMGGVIVRKGIHEAFMHGPEHVVEFFHGYTYSAHPLACAAGLATLDLYRDEDLFERAKKLEPLWCDAAMSLKGLPSVLDIRCVGLTVGIDLASKPDGVGKRGFEAMDRGFHDEGIMLRAVGDSLADVAAADRQRKPDRRDFRQDREGDQGAWLMIPKRRRETVFDNLAFALSDRPFASVSATI